MKLSTISFGASSLGGVFHFINEKEGIQAVHTAVEKGINFIDVSPYYGFTKAETVLSFCHYCLNDDALVDYLPLFEEHGVGIINASPLSMGLLSERGWPDWHPANEKLKERVVMAVNHCKSKNYRIEQLAMKFSVSNPEITTNLVSSSNPHNFTQNIRWTEEPQNETLLQEVLDILKPVNRLTWENT